VPWIEMDKTYVWAARNFFPFLGDLGEVLGCKPIESTPAKDGTGDGNTPGPVGR